MTPSDLRKLRTRMGWSQAEAARQLGCSKRSIANWETGTSAIPQSIALAASAALMNLPPYGEKPPPASGIHGNPAFSVENVARDVRAALEKRKGKR